MEATTEFATNALKSKGHTVYMAKNVVFKDSRSTRRIAIISEHALCIFKLKSDVIESEYFLNDLKSVIIKGNILVLKFKKILKFSLPEIYDFYVTLLDSARRLLTDKEFLRIHFTGYSPRSDDISSFGTYTRFFNQLKKEGIKISENTQVMMKDFFGSRARVFRNSSFGEFDKFSSALLTVLPMMNTLETLVLEEYKKIDPFLFASNVLRLGKTSIRNIVFKGGLTRNFTTFVHAFNEASSSTVIGLFFEDCELTRENMKLIIDLMSKRTLNAVGFHDSIAPKDLNFLKDTFLCSLLNSNISLLSFDGIKNINLTNLFSVINGVKVLSLRNCGINLFDFFQSMNSYNTLSLCEVDISGNTLLQPLMSSTLTCSITRIRADNVTFGSVCIQSFISLFLSNIKEGVCLSVANAKINALEWENVHVFFELAHYTSLKELVWDNNPISHSFMLFLAKQNRLKSLSLNNCFSPTMTTSIDGFTYVLDRTESLKILQIRSDSMNPFGTLALRVFGSIIKCKTLKAIDISGCTFGDDGIDRICKIIEGSQSLKYICLDRMSPDSGEGLYKLALCVEKCQNKVCSYPVNDIKNLQSKNAIEYPSVVAIQKCFKKYRDSDNTEYNAVLDSVSRSFNVFEGNIGEFFTLYRSVFKHVGVKNTDDKSIEHVEHVLDTISEIQCESSPEKVPKEKMTVAERVKMIKQKRATYVSDDEISIESIEISEICSPSNTTKKNKKKKRTIQGRSNKRDKLMSTSPGMYRSSDYVLADSYESLYTSKDSLLSKSQRTPRVSRTYVHQNPKHNELHDCSIPRCDGVVNHGYSSSNQSFQYTLNASYDWIGNTSPLSRNDATNHQSNPKLRRERPRSTERKQSRDSEQSNNGRKSHKSRKTHKPSAKKIVSNWELPQPNDSINAKDIWNKYEEQYSLVTLFTRVKDSNIAK